MSIVISSSGLCPSNTLVLNAFPNLARARPFSPELVESITVIADAELRAEPMQFDCGTANTEVPSKHWGSLEGWTFRRAWYYWVAEGPGIPPDIARKLHETNGQAVRVAGHCGCPGPQFYRGFAVGLYHVDTPDGLRALADTIKSIVAAAKPTANTEEDGE